MNKSLHGWGRSADCEHCGYDHSLLMSKYRAVGRHGTQKWQLLSDLMHSANNCSYMSECFAVNTIGNSDYGCIKHCGPVSDRPGTYKQ